VTAYVDAGHAVPLYDTVLLVMVAQPVGLVLAGATYLQFAMPNGLTEE
jgi:hypothetical protein